MSTTPLRPQKHSPDGEEPRTGAASAPPAPQAASLSDGPAAAGPEDDA